MADRDFFWGLEATKFCGELEVTVNSALGDCELCTGITVNYVWGDCAFMRWNDYEFMRLGDCK